MIVFPMAGKGRRFLEENYSLPKWKLPLAGRPMIEWVFLSFKNELEDEEVLVVFRGSDEDRESIKSSATKVGIRSLQLVEIFESRGQAESVFLGLGKAGVDQGEPITIFNIDTLRPGFSLAQVPSDCDGWLECVETRGSHWSFVEPKFDGSKLVGRVVEKQRISKFCCTGIYYFRSRRIFENAYHREVAAPSSIELFVAPLYNHIISAGKPVKFEVISHSQVVFCGTPEDYRAVRKKEDLISSLFD